MRQAVMKMENKGRSGCGWMSEPMQEECLESTQDTPWGSWDLHIERHLLPQ